MIDIQDLLLSRLLAFTTCLTSGACEEFFGSFVLFERFGIFPFLVLFRALIWLPHFHIITERKFLFCLFGQIFFVAFLNFFRLSF